PRGQGRGRAGPHRLRRSLPRERGAGEARRELHAAGSGRRPQEGGPPDGQGRVRGPERRQMIPELGHFALIVALTLAIAQTLFSFAGAHTGRMQLIGAARPIAIGQFLFVAAAFAALAWSFVTSDF